MTVMMGHSECSPAGHGTSRGFNLYPRVECDHLSLRLLEVAGVSSEGWSAMVASPMGDVLWSEC